MFLLGVLCALFVTVSSSADSCSNYIKKVCSNELNCKLYSVKTKTKPKYFNKILYYHIVSLIDNIINYSESI